MTAENITITCISSVLNLKKNKVKGEITYYTEKNGLFSYELIYRTKGEVETNFDGTMLYGKTDTVQFLPKGYGDKIYRVETIESGECIDVFFDTNIPLTDIAFCFKSPSYTKLREYFERISEIWLKKDKGFYYEAMSLLYRIIKLVCLGEEENTSKIEDSITYLNEHFCDADIDYEKVAELSSMSYSYFRRLFADFIGTSPAKYTMKKKIEYAKDLLLSKHYNVSEVAEITGFSDVYYFSHTFKKFTGVPPSKF